MCGRMHLPVRGDVRVRPAGVIEEVHDLRRDPFLEVPADDTVLELRAGEGVREPATGREVGRCTLGVGHLSVKTQRSAQRTRS